MTFDQIMSFLTAIGTVGACVVALIIALFGKRMEHVFYHPDLDLDAVVRRPEAIKVGRWQKVSDTEFRLIGDAWFFRLAITNNENAPARDVQVFLKKVEKLDGTVVDRFSPMNLRWTNTGETNRRVLLRDVPVFCDFIHVGDPDWRSKSGEDLETVPQGRAVMCLDVEATNTSRGHLLEPGAYNFHLVLAAENFEGRPFAVEVRYDGMWYADQAQMFDREIGFRMKKL
jgi:hypothetical protein